MIIFLYKFLNNRFIRKPTIKGIHLLLAGVAYLMFFSKSLSVFGAFYIMLPTIVIYIGILNEPYLYLWNKTNIMINTKFFKKRIFIYIHDEKISFSKKKAKWLWGINSPHGIILENSIFCRDFKKEDIQKLFKKYNIKILDNFGDLVYEIDKKDDIDMIKRRIMVSTL